MLALWSWMQVVDMNPSRVMFEIEKLVLQISQSILKVRTTSSSACLNNSKSYL